MKTFLITLLIFLTNISFASNDIPKNYSMSCWDGTFAYNELDIQTENGNLKFKASGQELGVFMNLINLPNPNVDTWGNLNVTYSVPSNSCKKSNTDPKILTCKELELNVRVTGTVGSNTKIDQVVKIKDAVIQIRHVNELSLWGNNTSGYELVIASNHIRSAPSLSHRYFYGMEENETGNCKIN